MDEQHRLSVPRAGLCGSRLPGAVLTYDSECAARNLVVRGTVIDHIIPVTGPDDPTFFRPEAHQLLCAKCHDQKRQRESRGVVRTQAPGGMPVLGPIDTETPPGYL